MIGNPLIQVSLFFSWNGTVAALVVVPTQTPNPVIVQLYRSDVRVQAPVSLHPRHEFDSGCAHLVWSPNEKPGSS